MKISTTWRATTAAISVALVAAKSPAPSPSPDGMDSSGPGYGDMQDCWPVSVVLDATYCIQGPICSGDGDAPIGTNCPKQGDMAVDDCWSYLNSYGDDGNCVLSQNTSCEKIETGAWACVLPSYQDTSSPTDQTPAPSPSPTDESTAVPTPEPTTMDPTEEPTESPTPKPTQGTDAPDTDAPDTDAPNTEAPTPTPSPSPTDESTAVPTPEPTTMEPTEEPTETPTSAPSPTPSQSEDAPSTDAPIDQTPPPSPSPTEESTSVPTPEPTPEPTTMEPTEEPTETPTSTPEPTTTEPTEEPSETPTSTPSPSPTEESTSVPTPEPTPEPTTMEPTKEPTPAPTPNTTEPAGPGYDEDLQCWPVSVVSDATYCIQGPICSGTGEEPLGSSCPEEGDVAVDNCRSSLNSSTTNGDCVLPQNSTCEKIDTGAWACVLSSTNASNQSSTEEVTFPEDSEKLQLSAHASGAGTSTLAIVGSVGAVAAVGCAIAGTILYKRNKKRMDDALSDDILTP